MDEFFESDNQIAQVNVVDREMRRQEMRRAKTRKVMTGVISIALAGSVLLGGGYAAVASTHQTATKKVVKASKADKKIVKHKKHPKKSNS